MIARFATVTAAFLAIVFGIYSIADAVQVTVPSSSGAGFVLVSTSTGAYIATTTSPLHATTFYAQSQSVASFLPYASTTALSATNFWEPGQSAGCAQFDANAKLASTGVNCGSGGGGGGTGTVSTSSAESPGFVAYWTSNSATPALLGKVATSAPGVTGPITYSGTFGAFVGGTGGNFGCTTATGSVPGCLSAADWGTFNGKQASLGYVPWGGTLSTTFATTTIASTTPLWAKTGIFASSTSQLDQASSTEITTGTLWDTSLTSVLALFDANHKETAYGGASSCGANNFFTGLSAAGASTCGTAAISGVNLGSNLFSLQPDGTSITGTAFNGSAAVSNWAINLGNSNAWTASTTFTKVVNLQNASTSLSTIIGSWWVPQTSALLLAGSGGLVGSYGGAAACSANNFVTTLSAVGGTTCGTAAISGTNLGGTLPSLTKSGTTLNGTAYNGSAAVSDWAINLTNANTWTGLQLFSGAGTTTIANGLEVGTKVGAPYFNATSSTASSTFAGGVQINGGLNLASGVSGFLKAASGVVSTSLISLTADITGTLGAGNGGTGATSLSPAFSVVSNVLSDVREQSFTYATTTWTGTTTRALFQGTIASTISGFRCKTYTTNSAPGGTLNIQVGKWTASTTMMNASSTNNFNVFSANNTVAAGDSWYVEIGTPASTPIQINCTYKFTV